eukprot:gene8432-9919_t
MVDKAKGYVNEATHGSRGDSYGNSSGYREAPIRDQGYREAPLRDQGYRNDAPLRNEARYEPVRGPADRRGDFDGRRGDGRYVDKDYHRTGGKDYYSRDEYLQDYHHEFNERNGRPQGPLDQAKNALKKDPAARQENIRQARYQDRYQPTQVHGGLEAPLLGPDGLPLNAASINAPVDIQLKRHLASVERLMDTRIYREKTDERTKMIIMDIRNIMADAILLIETRGVDQQMMNIFQDLMLFKSDMTNNSDIKTVAMDWKSTVMKLVQNDNGKGMLASSTKVINDLRQSDSLLKLASEGAKFFQMVVLDSKNPGLEAQRELVFDLFFKSFGVLSQNPAWQEFVLKGKSFGNTVVETNKYEAKTAGSKLKGIAQNRNLNNMGNNSKNLLQSFIRDKSVADVDKFLQYGQESAVELKKNPAYASFFNDFQQITLEIMENPALLDDPNTRKVIRDMYNRGEAMLTETRNMPSIQAFASEGGRIKEGIMTDELNSRFYQHLRKLLNDLQPNGKSAIDLNLINQFKMLFVPFLLEEFRTISIPAQSGMDPKKTVGYRIGNINLSSIELLPENIHFEFSHKVNADPYSLTLVDPDTVIWVELTSIRCRIEKLQWAFEKFTFPRLKDAGLADIYVDERGVRVGVELRLLTNGRQRFTQVLDSYCHIDHLDVRLYNCKHKMLYSIFNKMFMGIVKKQVEKAVAEKMAQMIAETDYMLVEKYQVARQQSQQRSAKLQSNINVWKTKALNKAKTAQSKVKPIGQTNFFKNVVGEKPLSERLTTGIATATNASQTTTSTTTTYGSTGLATAAPIYTQQQTAYVAPVAVQAAAVPTTQYVLAPVGTTLGQQSQQFVQQGTTLGGPSASILTTNATTEPILVKTIETTVLEKGGDVITQSIAPTYVGPSSN